MRLNDPRRSGNGWLRRRHIFFSQFSPALPATFFVVMAFDYYYTWCSLVGFTVFADCGILRRRSVEQHISLQHEYSEKVLSPIDRMKEIECYCAFRVLSLHLSWRFKSTLVLLMSVKTPFNHLHAPILLHRDKTRTTRLYIFFCWLLFFLLLQVFKLCSQWICLFFYFFLNKISHRLKCKNKCNYKYIYMTNIWFSNISAPKLPFDKTQNIILIIYLITLTHYQLGQNRFYVV